MESRHSPSFGSKSLPAFGMDRASNSHPAKVTSLTVENPRLPSIHEILGSYKPINTNNGFEFPGLNDFPEDATTKRKWNPDHAELIDHTTDISAAPKRVKSPSWNRGWTRDSQCYSNSSRQDKRLSDARRCFEHHAALEEKGEESIGAYQPGSGYPAIDSNENEIRIVDVYPAKNFDDPIEIGVRKANLSDSPLYDALSYVWDPIDTDALDKEEFAGEVQIKTMSGLRLSIGENLESALRHLRDKEKVLPMWVDAICIDQSNVRERNHQVQLMSKLYSTARHVIVWLGPSDSVSEIVMKCIKEGDILSENLGHDLADFLSQLEEFLERDWFRRVWIVQELTLARIDPFVVCGHEEVRWSLCYLAIRLFRSKIRHMKPDFCFLDRAYFKALRHYKVTNNDLEDFEDIEDSDLIGEQVEMLGDIRCSGSFASFPEQLYRTVTIEARSTDPRDMVYGLLGISRFSGMKIEPDYTKSIASVFSEAMTVVIQQGFVYGYPYMPLRSSNIPCKGLPSWVPDFTGTALRDKRDSPSSTEGIRPSRTEIEHAIARTAGLAPIASFSPDLTTLTTAGIRLGTMVRTLSARDLWVLGFAKTESAQARFNAFIHGYNIPINMMLVAILGSENPVIPSPRSELSAAMADWLGRIRHAEFMELDNYSKEKEPVEMDLFKRALRYSCRVDRTLFITDTGLFGLAHKAAKGDVLAGLFGINLPFVLKRRGNEWKMANLAFVAGHKLGHDFVERSKPVEDWRGFRRDGMMEFVIV